VKPLDLAALAEKLLRAAKHNVERYGHVIPVAFIVHAGIIETIALQFEDAEQKRQAYTWVSDRCRALDADAVILINEAWMVMEQHATGETTEEILGRVEELPPSRNPRRREVITMTVVGPGFKPTLTIIPFRRQGKKIQFEEKVTQSEYPEVEVLMIPRWWTNAPKVS
jgi:hypothetical protein